MYVIIAHDIMIDTARLIIVVIITVRTPDDRDAILPSSRIDLAYTANVYIPALQYSDSNKRTVYLPIISIMVMQY